MRFELESKPADRRELNWRLFYKVAEARAARFSPSRFWRATRLTGSPNPRSHETNRS